MPLRSKMVPRSAGSVTVCTRCPTPIDCSCVWSRAWRSTRRAPIPRNASVITAKRMVSRSRMGGSGAPRRGRVMAGYRGWLHLLPVAERRGRLPTHRRRRRRARDLQIRRRIVRPDEAEPLRLLDDPAAARPGSTPSVAATSYSRRAELISRLETVELQLTLRQDHVEHDRADEREDGREHDERGDPAGPRVGREAKRGA